MSSGCAAASTPSESEVRNAILSWLPTVDFMSVTRKVCTAEMETLHGWDLSSMKDFVRGVLAEFVDTETTKLMESTVVEEDQPAKKKKGGSGFTKPVQLSDALAAFMKSDFAPRTEVTKEIWRHIKEHNLQNPADKREIICDDVLRSVLKRDKIHFMKMSKVLSDQMKPLNELQDAGGSATATATATAESKITGKGKNGSSGDKKRKGAEEEPSSTKKKVKNEKESASSSSSSSVVKKEKKKGGSSSDGSAGGGWQAKLQLSPALASVLGVQSESRTQVVSRMWVYIKERGLQNPADKREILLDSPLKKAFGVDSFTMFSMNKYLVPHLTKID